MYLQIRVFRWRNNLQRWVENKSEEKYNGTAALSTAASFMRGGGGTPICGLDRYVPPNSKVFEGLHPQKIVGYRFCCCWRCVPVVILTDSVPIICMKIIPVICATFALAKRKPEKKSRLVRDTNPWPLRYRCSPLPVKLTSQLEAGRWIGSL